MLNVLLLGTNFFSHFLVWISNEVKNLAAMKRNAVMTNHWYEYKLLSFSQCTCSCELYALPRSYSMSNVLSYSASSMMKKPGAVSGKDAASTSKCINPVAKRF